MSRPLDRLLAIMARLRDPEHGCPWDREQDFSTIAPYTIEEAYEVADAIARGDTPALKDELGDLLFQVVFHARMAEEAGLFVFDDVAAAIADKMKRRHPHVFGAAEITSVAAQNEAWEEHKAAERRDRAQANGAAESVLDGVALALPALLRAVKLQKRAARIGFDWPEARPVFDKIAEEIAELESGARTRCRSRASGGRDGRSSLCRRQPRAQARYRSRNGAAACNRQVRAPFPASRGARRSSARAGTDLDALEALWQEVKREERQS